MAIESVLSSTDYPINSNLAQSREVVVRTCRSCDCCDGNSGCTSPEMETGVKWEARQDNNCKSLHSTGCLADFRQRICRNAATSILLVNNLTSSLNLATQISNNWKKVWQFYDFQSDVYVCFCVLTCVHG